MPNWEALRRFAQICLFWSLCSPTKCLSQKTRGGQNFFCTYLIKAKTIRSRVEKIQVIVILQNSSYKTVIKCLYFLSEDQMCENNPYCGAKQVILESQYKFKMSITGLVAKFSHFITYYGKTFFHSVPINRLK